MSLQDLTPELRTRLSRMERTVGLFVASALILLLAGLIFYAYQVAKRKGWFLQKMPYYTYVRSGAGLKVGQPVQLMGFDVGEITEINTLPPDFYYLNVFVGFTVREPYYGYLWDDSRAKVAPGDLLGNRFIELTKGTNGAPTYLFQVAREYPTSSLPALLGKTNLALGQILYDAAHSNVIGTLNKRLSQQLVRDIASSGVESVVLIDYAAHARLPTRIWNYQENRYEPFDRKSENGRKGFFLPPEEAPAIGDRIEKVMNTIETALPGVLDVTNQLKATLRDAAGAAASAESLLASLRPVTTNLVFITTQLTNGQGALGEWLLPTNLSAQLTQTLAAATATMTNASLLFTNADARLDQIALSLLENLENLAGITSNLHAQVNANTNLLGSASQLIIDADDLAQGLKRHWFLRSAFKSRPTNAPPAKASRATKP